MRKYLMVAWRQKDEVKWAIHGAGILLLSLLIGCAGPKYYANPKANFGNIKKLAVLPLESLIPDEYAGEKIRRIVITELLSRGIDVVEPGEVTSSLKELKIRSVGSIKVKDVQEMGKTLEVDAIIMGSVEALGISRGISVPYPEVSIHLLLLETQSGSIMWSVWHTSGGAGFWSRHFGTEGSTLSETSRKVVRQAVGTLFEK